MKNVFVVTCNLGNLGSFVLMICKSKPTRKDILKKLVKKEPKYVYDHGKIGFEFISDKYEYVDDMIRNIDCLLDDVMFNLEHTSFSTGKMKIED